MCEAKAIFIINGISTTFTCEANEKFKDIFQRLAIKLNLNINKMTFLYNGDIINPESKFEEVISREDKINNIMKNIIVDKMNNEEIKEEKKILSKYIICKECKEVASIKIENYRINISCRNGHNINNLSINEFENTQIIDIAKIQCYDCKAKNKGNTHDNEFYKCMTCNQNICPLCKMKHKYHKVFNYDLLTYICNKHYEGYTRYCSNCNENICFLCEKDHIGHKGVNLWEMRFNDNNYLKNLKENIEKLKGEIKEIINKLENIIINMEIYYKLSDNIINNNEKRNYEILKNINEFINTNISIIKDIEHISKDNDKNHIFNNIINIYNKMNNDENSINYIIGEMNIKEEDINKEIRIINSFEECKRELKWGDCVDDYKCENEKDIKEKCLIKINNKSIPFCYKNKFNKTGKYIIEYSFIDKITKINDMFYGCKSLTRLNFSNFNTQNVTNMARMFRYCKSLSSLILTNFNTQNVTDMECMFCGCKSLSSLNLSNFNTKNVTNMKYMFYGCERLSSLNLSNFKIGNASVDSMFRNCKSLKKENVIANDEKILNMLIHDS